MQSQAKDARIKAKTAGLKALQLSAYVKYAFPGGYEIYGITGDGGILCVDCIRANYADIYRDTRENDKGNGYNSGWEIVANTTEAEVENCHCSHCNKMLGYYNEATA